MTGLNKFFRFISILVIIVKMLITSLAFRIIIIARIALIKKGFGTRIYHDVFVKYPANILIGRNVFINQGCILWAAPKSKIKIGDDVLFGPRVQLIASNHGIKLDNLVRLNKWEDKDIIIGSDVWLGAHSIVLAGVTIEDGAVIGAGAVVTKNIEKNSIAAGVPAKIIGYRSHE